MPLRVVGLGQAGFRLQFDDAVLYIDPYLSDSVADTHGPGLRRLQPAPLAPGDVTDATHVLITHAHEDHADKTTLEPLALASPHASFICPPPVAAILRTAGIATERIVPACESWQRLTPTVSVRAVPAAHLSIERDPVGALTCVGYLLRADARTLYHAGDTIPHETIIATLRSEGPPDYAMLPVNERNYFRDAQGIVGNMSVRESFLFAEAIGARCVIPIHWDLFAPNSTPKAEIEFFYDLVRPPFELRLCESGDPKQLW